MEIKYDNSTQKYVLGNTPYTKDEFIAYIKADMLKTALGTGQYTMDLSAAAVDNELEIDLDVASRVPYSFNILVYGVPGVGKSWTIQHEYCDKDTIVKRIVFYPDYTYSDFVGQILPTVTNNGLVNYKFIPGPFTSILKEAYRNPDKKYALIIEEINRGNAPAIFGEIFQLLDRVEEGQVSDFPIGTSIYGIYNENIAKEICGNKNRIVRIPANLSIIATMNTSDQNVFTLDTAFQRRWELRLVENNFEALESSLADALILDTTVTWKHFCITINEIISKDAIGMGVSDDKRLGTHFVSVRDLEFKVNANTAEDRRQNRKFAEKVVKYLWDDAFKFNRDEVFDIGNNPNLEQVIRNFLDSTGDDRFNIFTESIKDKLINGSR